MTNSGKVICPLCGADTFIDSHTPFSDHPELSTDRHECKVCDWHSDEWPTPTISTGRGNYNQAMPGNSLLPKTANPVSIEGQHEKIRHL
jgi:hypothetical protein